MEQALKEIRNTIKELNITERSSKIIIAVGTLRRTEISKDDTLKIIEMCIEGKI